MPNYSKMSQDELFGLYLSVIDTPQANDILPFLHKTKASSSSRLELLIPEEWGKEFMKEVFNGTVMYSESKTRYTSADSPKQPNLVTDDVYPRHAANIRWPGEIVTESFLFDDKPNPYDPNENPLKLGRIEYHVNVAQYVDKSEIIDSLIRSMAYEIAKMLDVSMTGTLENFNNNPIAGIINNKDVFGHESTSRECVSGYIDCQETSLNTLNPDTIKTTLGHLPRGYRNRAKWYMNTETAFAIEQIKPSDSNPFTVNVDGERFWTPYSQGWLLGKPVVINEYMPSKGITVILADLTRGYIMLRDLEDLVLIVTGYSIGIRFKTAGRVLQPAAFKGIRSNFEFEYKEVDLSGFEIQTEYDEEGNEVFY